MSNQVKQIIKVPKAKRVTIVSQTRQPEHSQSLFSPIDRILYLQRTAGNQAVQRLVHSGVLQANQVIQQGYTGSFVQCKPSENTEHNKVQQYLDDGIKAVAYTREKLQQGMGNFKNDYSDSRTLDRLKIGYDLYAKDKKGNENVILGAIGAFGALYAPEIMLIVGRASGYADDDRLKKQLTEAIEKGNKAEVLRLQQKVFERTAALGERLKFGNCSEHASICYLYLRDKTKSRPLEVLITSDHAFVTLGRSPVKSPDPREWGDTTVICDAYYNEVYLLGNGVLRSRQAGANLTQGRLEE
jgi:hypothetical protein